MDKIRSRTSPVGTEICWRGENLKIRPLITSPVEIVTEFSVQFMSKKLKLLNSMMLSTYTNNLAINSQNSEFHQKECLEGNIHMSSRHLYPCVI